MAVHQDGGLVELTQHDANGTQGAGEARLDAGAPGVEGDIVRHVEDDVVSLASDAYAAGPQFPPQHRFLLVHVVANTSACKTSQGGADEGPASGVAIANVVADYGSKKGSSRSAPESPGGCLGDLLFARVGILGDTTGETEGGGEGSDEESWSRRGG